MTRDGRAWQDNNELYSGGGAELMAEIRIHPPPPICNFYAEFYSHGF